MNLRDKFTQTRFLIFANLLSLVIISLLTLHHFKKHTEYLERSNRKLIETINKVARTDEDPKSFKTLEYKEPSFNKSHEVLVYQMKFDTLLYGDYYKEYFPNKKIILVRDLDSQKENVVFTGEERTNNPHWLGNEHIFFTTYCGTACKGVYLVNTNNKESGLAVWSYIFSMEKNSWETHFKDWFGKKFIIEGLVDSLESEIVNGQPYLIFKMKNDKGDSLGEKRFLFTGKSLI